MNSPNKLLSKFTSLLAMGACILSVNQVQAADAIAAGDGFAGAINDSKLRTWGSNDEGQLGLGNNVTPQPAPQVVGNNYVLVEAGPNFMFGITNSSEVYAWGNNTFAQLGIGNEQSASINEPTQIVFPGQSDSPVIVDVAAGYNTAYAIDEDGVLWAWGENGDFELGIGIWNDPNPDSLNDTLVERPFKVVGSLWKDVAVAKSDSTSFTVGIKQDGTMWAWGLAASLVGAPTGIEIRVPYQIGSASNWEEVEVGNLQVVARTTDGKVYTWGAGIALGQGMSITQSSTPRLLSVSGVSEWVAIGVGFDTSFAIDSGGRLWGWGNNSNFQLGPYTSSTNIMFTPVEVSPGYVFTAVAGGYGSIDTDARDGFTVAAGQGTGTEGFFTFGANANGQLGIGGISYGLSPYPQRAAADGLAVSINNPTVDAQSSDIVVGINTTHDFTMTVTNSGEADIVDGYTVELYLGLASDAPLDPDVDTLLGSVTISETLGVGQSRTITNEFKDITIGNIAAGDYYVYSRVTLGGTSPDADSSDNVGETRISVRLPNLLISSVDLPQQEINLSNGEDFTGVTVSIMNNGLGAILPESDVAPIVPAIPLTVFLSDDETYSESDLPLTLSPAVVEHTDGLTYNEEADFPQFDILIPTGTAPGQKYLIFIADVDQLFPDSNPDDNTVVSAVSLYSDERIDQAIDYGYYKSFPSVGAEGKSWRSVPDTLASGDLAYQSPVLDMGQNITLSTVVIGPTVLNVPWRIEADAADNVEISVSGGTVTYPSGSSKKISGYVPVYQTNKISLDDAATYVVNWTYSQVSNLQSSVARLDLDIPVFSTSGDGDWSGQFDPTAPVTVIGWPDTMDTRSVFSPILEEGQTASFEVDVIGPALITFWVKTEGHEDNTVSFLVDGVVQNLPTQDFDEETRPATFSGDTAWQKVAFLIEGGPRNLRWLYSQNVANTDILTSRAYIDGLAVLTPIPEENSPNRSSVNPPDPQFTEIPEYNIDLAVQDIEATPGNYILDDANGTGRLPLTVVVGSIGADFNMASLNLNTNFTSLIEVHLSLDTTFGNADDVNLGSFAETQIINQGDKVVMSAILNLPLDTPAGDYNIFVRFLPPPEIKEFSYVNNTALLGPGFVIIRAPNLVVDSILVPSDTYPFHPEDTLPLNYTITNPGLGTIGLNDTFDVQVSLYAYNRYAVAPTREDSLLIMDYEPYELSVFLPEVSATYPDGGSTEINQFITLPSLRDFLVALQYVPSGTAEDSTALLSYQDELELYGYFFVITVDSGDNILESSESNLFYQQYVNIYNYVAPKIFYMAAVPGLENYGSYTGQLPFSDELGGANDLSDATGNNDNDQLPNLVEYALGTDPTDDTPILVGASSNAAWGAYNIQMLTIPPYTEPQPYLTMTFDFNVRATDITIQVQANSDMNFQPDDTILTLSPPYIDDFGPQSLTGFNGLKDHPLVLSVNGNVTGADDIGLGGVQKVYTARITVRDNQPLDLNDADPYSSRFVRLLVDSNLVAPLQPLNFTANYDGFTGFVELDWDAGDPVDPAQGGAFQILRAVGSSSNFEAIASTENTTFIDTTVGIETTYSYKLRLVNTEGISAESTTETVVVP